MPTLRLPSADEDEDDVEDDEVLLPVALEEPEVPVAEEESEEESDDESEVPVADAAESVALEPEAPVDWAGVPVEVK